MKAKINFSKDSTGRVKMQYAGLKKEKSVSPVYKNSICEAKQTAISYSKVEESVMKRKFSI